MDGYEDLPEKGKASDPYADLPTGAAFGVYPQQRAVPSRPQTIERVKELGGATAAGAALGAAAPEMTQFAGKALQKFPQTAALGYMLEPAGQALKSRRLAETGLGAVGGGAADIAGQVAKEAGYGVPGQFLAQTVAGMGTPAIAQMAGGAVRAGLGKILPGGMAAVPSMADLSVRQVPASKAKLIQQQIQQLRGDPRLAGVPQEELYKALQLGATDIESLARQQAGGERLLGQYQAREAEAKAGKMSTAAKRSEQLSAAEAQAAKQARAQVGQEREASDIGQAIRQKIDERFSSQAQARSQAYRQQMAERDAVVAAKEEAGQLVNALPEYKSLVDELRQKLLIGAAAQEQKTAPVTEPGVLRAYQNIYDAVTSRRIQVGVNEMGNPIYKTFPTSFQALDDVRRRLGDVAFGKEVEGYGAIGQKMAERYYGKISELQSKFAGEAHDILQRDYEAASRLLEKFKGKAGKKATALDRLDPSTYATDASSLPSNYFRSRQSVEDLLELSGGDRAFVTKQASDFAARELRDLNAKGVQNWINKNSDWLNTLPEVRTKVEIYQRGLQRGERIVGKSEKAVSTLAGREKETLKAGERALTEAEKRAAGVTAEAEQRVKTILGDAFPARRIEEIILSGSPKTWQEIGPILASTPNGKQLVAQAVNQIMADRASRGLVTAVQVFNQDVGPALRSAGLMSDGQIRALSQQLEQIKNTTVGEPAKLTMMQNIIKNTLVALTAQPVGAAGVSAADMLNRRGQVGSVANIPR